MSKTFDAAAIRPFLDAGQRVFGENRVQEAKEKWPELRASYDGIELHLIGPLQTNKAREAVALFDVIQTVDRDKLAGILAEEMKRAGKRLPVFVQVNIGLEEQKAGVAPSDAAAFVGRCKDLHGLDVVGLMCVPPEGDPAGPPRRDAPPAVAAAHRRAPRAAQGAAALRGVAAELAGLIVPIGVAAVAVDADAGAAELGGTDGGRGTRRGGSEAFRAAFLGARPRPGGADARQLGRAACRGGG